MKNLHTFIIILLTISTIQSQEVTNSAPLDVKLTSSVSVNGTSTLHDWESIVELTNAKMTLKSLDERSIETLEVKIKATSIKSGKKIMDKLTYEALKAKEHPLITFIFKKGEIVSDTTKILTLRLQGDLTIAGVTKNVAVLTTINKLKNQTTLNGEYKLKMTDYGIKPPKALLGTIKTGNEITIKFNLNF